MLRNVFFVLIIFFGINQSEVYSQKNGVVLIFKDGTRLKGLGKKLSNGTMKYRKNKKEKARFIDLKDVEKIKIYKKDGVYFRAYKKIKGTSKYKYLELIEEGKLTIYRKFKPVYLPTDRNGQPLYFFEKNLVDYYVQREGEEEVTPLISSGFFSVNFKKVALDYFSDCEELIDKIKQEELTKDDFSLIVDFYNYECE
ncbi:hypothetical protein D1818_03225 [Aquimarina sp. BL5]|uniref:hypothetical protein n=1 Tax=Aquimarina sp. BL5 TaxID=1714860 RepID=UPI000E47C371|nr:hypothetical protein [Aquimarina sp. BL5]AXT49882.1 hypothetical protein D1818_03225 [Aquimarina sp. BL5]RKN01805.1 hypothetical protein D7036_17340 [Aquimarina sp. BL5]